MQEYTGLIIQTHVSIYFFEMNEPDVCIKLIEDQYSVKLEVQRSLSDNFYYALRNNSGATDALYVIKFYVDEDKCKLMFNNEQINASMIKGRILALEMNPLDTNDIES